MNLSGSISVPLAVGFDNPYLIQQSLDALVGPLGFGLAIGSGLLIFAALAYRRFFWVVVTLLLVASTLTSHLTTEFNNPYSRVIQTAAEQGRNLVLALLLVLALPSLMINKGTRSRIIHPALVAYLAFQLLYTFEIAASRSQGSLIRLIIGAALFLLTFLCLGFGLSKMLQTGVDALDAVRSLAWAGVIVSLITIFELLTNPKSVVINGRISSVAGTATFAAELFVATMLPALYLAIRPEAVRLVRYFWIAVLAIEGMLLIGTGTRTGILMLFVGLVVMLRSRLAKLFPLAVGLAALITVVLFFLPEDLGILGAQRMLDTTDTRTDVWRQGIDAFLGSPFFGVSVEGANMLIENSYIDAFATSGLIGVIPFLTALLLFGRSMLQLQSRRSTWDRSNQLFVDFLIGSFIAELVGAVFDAYLLATVSIQLYVVVILGSLMYFVLDRSSDSQAQFQPAISNAPTLNYDPAYAI